mmetsp:Transcript_2258/g.2731  ORF Transcript_2258/g.2731 Transcript_2258/m.2731 type:complete len:118 (-) Transcript_2258:310-663(-)|eukprot:CAMPEP_0203643228 /NCGR_PEP_ID=MMETSP0088-20131115/8666_1 /ASSEMBLY_ACC=CAM_ASM_001087 /TAXON_ID=426623 /ORGANISM="Chaetoceros affinis, Strain CCMP159" /LENGTH=117 /DNA_ID=CAMNT_0050499341 /DNA_START=41 /DNA_END=394 /DNA_ORIENTATION=+
MASSGNPVDYGDAMEQCGGDKEFLIELLHDLKSELETQLLNIQQALENEPDVESYDAVRRAAHVIKGASANLCCNGLRDSASDLENAAKICCDAIMRSNFDRLKAEAAKFVAYLPHI